MPWPSRENDHAWKDPQHAGQDLQHAWVKHAWKDPQHVWKDLQHAWIDLQIAIRSDRERRPPNENMTALADDLVSSKYRFTRFGTPPRQRAPRETATHVSHRVKTVSIPSRRPPVQLTMIRLLMRRTADGMANCSDNGYLDREVC